MQRCRESGAAGGAAGGGSAGGGSAGAGQPPPGRVVGRPPDQAAELGVIGRARTGRSGGVGRAGLGRGVGSGPDAGAGRARAGDAAERGEMETRRRAFRRSPRGRNPFGPRPHPGRRRRPIDPAEEVPRPRNPRATRQATHTRYGAGRGRPGAARGRSADANDWIATPLAWRLGARRNAGATRTARGDGWARGGGHREGPNARDGVARADGRTGGCCGAREPRSGVRKGPRTETHVRFAVSPTPGRDSGARSDAAASSWRQEDRWSADASEPPTDREPPPDGRTRRRTVASLRRRTRVFASGSVLHQNQVGARVGESEGDLWVGGACPRVVTVGVCVWAPLCARESRACEA